MRAIAISPTGLARVHCLPTPLARAVVVPGSLNLALPVKAELMRADTEKSPGRERAPCHHLHLLPWSVVARVAEAVLGLSMTTVATLEANAEPRRQHGVLVSVARKAAVPLVGRSESAQRPLPLSSTTSGVPRCDRIQLPASLPFRLAQPARPPIHRLWHPPLLPPLLDVPDSTCRSARFRRHQV